MTYEENRAALKEEADRSANGTYTDQQLADWVPKNFVPKDPADQESRARAISNRVLTVIRAVREHQKPNIADLLATHGARDVLLALATAADAQALALEQRQTKSAADAVTIFANHTNASMLRALADRVYPEQAGKYERPSTCQTHRTKTLPARNLSAACP